MLSTVEASNNAHDDAGKWMTKKSNCETTVKKRLERRVQRLVVLENGRVIVEDEPQVTVDTIEDTRNNNGNDDKSGIWDQRSLGHYSGQVLSGSKERCNIEEQRIQRNIKSFDTCENSVSSVAAYNLGEIPVGDVGRVITQGDKALKELIKPYAVDNSLLVLQGRITDRNYSHKKNIDAETVTEISKQNDKGKIETQKWTTRELIDENSDDYPDEASSFSDSSESRDGDIEGFTQQKQDRYIDYYKVPKGKTLKDATFLAHGIHMSSSDKQDIPYPAALKKNRSRLPLESSSYGSVRDLHQNVRTSKNDTPDRFSQIRRSNTIERSNRRRSTPVPSEYSVNSDESSRLSSHRTHSMNRAWRKPPNKPQSSHGSNRSVASSNSDGRKQRPEMKRTTSLNSGENKNSTSQQGGGIFGSMKSLYATIIKKKDRNVVDVNKDWFDKAANETNSGPIRPPRKHDGRKNERGFYAETNGYGRRQWDIYSGSTLSRDKSHSDYALGSDISHTYTQVRNRNHVDSGRPRGAKQNGHYFGQLGDSDVESENESRPAPDMRRLLLKSVSQSKQNNNNKVSNNHIGKSTVRAI